MLSPQGIGHPRKAIDCESLCRKQDHCDFNDDELSELGDDAERNDEGRWMRVPGDIVFSIGAVAFAWFVLGLMTGHSYDRGQSAGQDLRSHETYNEHEEALAAR